MHHMTPIEAMSPHRTQIPRIIITVLLVTGAAALESGRQSSTIRRDGYDTPPADGLHDIDSLPGLRGEALPARHRAGYVTVDAREGRRLWYYLAGAQDEEGAASGGGGGRDRAAGAPPPPPLIVWLTGGPGCSSLDAFTYEHGPFTFSLGAGGVELARNPYAWAAAPAHVAYVDSPAGTGYSYAPGGAERGYRTDDARTVEDLLELVLGLLRDAPDLRDSDVYIAGESYAGVYVPELARRILRHNRDLARGGGSSEGSSVDNESESGNESNGGGGGGGGGYRRRRVRLVGYVVGNGVTDDATDGDAQVPYAYGTGLLDEHTHAFVQAACNGSYWDARRGSACWDALDLADAAIGPVNPYDVGSPCVFPPHPRPPPPPPAAAGAGAGVGAGSAAEAEGAGERRRRWPFAAVFEPGAPVSNWWKEAGGSGSGSSGSGGSSKAGGGTRLRHTVACADRRAALAYWNDPRVRRAVHAAPASAAGRWEPCSDVLEYARTATGIAGVHADLVAAGLDALVLSGTADYVVPFTGTRAWTAGLGLPIEFPWRAWKVGRQVGGHAVRYRAAAPGGGRLTFATVLGAGHMVPSGRPAAALTLLREWLARRV